MSNTALVLPQKFVQLSERLNNRVMSVINSETIAGFERAYTIAIAAKELEESLTAEYMQPIMALQGNRLGFKTDKDNTGGYPEPVVKKCLIEAVLMGLQPFGNQFNIIAGNTYATKEGMGACLKNFKGLTYEIIPQLPRIDTNKGSAAIVMKIRWTLNGAAQERDIDFAIKVNNFMGSDAVIGKATRKARKWLHDTISGFEIPEGDITDTDIKGVNTSADINKEEERIIALLSDAKTEKDLHKIIDGLTDAQKETHSLLINNRVDSFLK